jgi:hypothetical protein
VLRSIRPTRRRRVGHRPADAGFVANQRAPDIACLPRMTSLQYRTAPRGATGLDGGLSATHRQKVKPRVHRVHQTMLWLILLIVLIVLLVGGVGYRRRF